MPPPAWKSSATPVRFRPTKREAFVSHFMADDQHRALYRSTSEAKQAYCVIQTGELRFYGCFAFRKGVVPARRSSRRHGFWQSRSLSLASFSPIPPIALRVPPRMGETILGTGFQPWGLAARAQTKRSPLRGWVPTSHSSRGLGQDPFAEIAMKTWAGAGVNPAVIKTPQNYTGAAYIFVEESTGRYAIIVAPGAAWLISPDDIDCNFRLHGRLSSWCRGTTERASGDDALGLRRSVAFG